MKPEKRITKNKTNSKLSPTQSASSVICAEVTCFTHVTPIAVITVAPAVQRFSRESEAFGSSFWRESVYVSSILTFWLFCRTSDSFYRLWGIAQPMDAPTEVTRWDGRTYRGISIAFVIWRGQAPLNIWTFLGKICVWRYVSPYYLLETPHFHALLHGNRWTTGSTVITAIVPLHLL